MSEESHLPELTDAARRAESIVSDQINAIVDVVQREADEIRRSAEDDARATRTGAMESAHRVLQRLDALERPLGELVQTLRKEMDRVGRELEGSVAVEVTAIPPPPEGPAAETAPGDGAPVAEVVAEPEPKPPSEPEPEPEPPSEPEPKRRPKPERKPRPEPERQATTPTSEPAREEATTQHDESASAEAVRSGQGNRTQAHDSPADQPQPILHSPADLEPEKKSGRFLFRRKDGRGKGPFITSQGHCAVCQKTFMAGTEENLRLSGWKVSGDVGVCPECQADGWQLPDGARLPFRRGGG